MYIYIYVCVCVCEKSSMLVFIRLETSLKLN